MRWIIVSCEALLKPDSNAPADTRTGACTAANRNTEPWPTDGIGRDIHPSSFTSDPLRHKVLLNHGCIPFTYQA